VLLSLDGLAFWQSSIVSWFDHGSQLEAVRGNLDLVVEVDKEILSRLPIPEEFACPILRLSYYMGRRMIWKISSNLVTLTTFGDATDLQGEQG
jgi:hypothetical protein